MFRLKQSFEPLVYSFVIICVVGCQPSKPLSVTDSATDKVTIVAAANLKPMLPRLIEIFEKAHLNCQVEASYAASGVIAQQLLMGQQADVFLSADVNYCINASNELKLDRKPFIYAGGQLCVVSKQAITEFDLIDWNEFKSGSQKILAIANPKTAPYGKAARDLLTELKIDEGRVAIAPDVFAVVPMVQTDAAELGFTSFSVKFANPEVTDDLNFIAVPLDRYNNIEQAGLVLDDKEVVLEFVEFLLSDSAQEIFEQAGYRRVGKINN